MRSWSVGHVGFSLGAGPPEKQERREMGFCLGAGHPEKQEHGAGGVLPGARDPLRSRSVGQVGFSLGVVPS